MLRFPLSHCKLTVASWNVASLLKVYRIAQISNRFAQTALVALQGTRIPARGLPHSGETTSDHFIVHAGWQRGAYTNKFAGVCLLIHNKKFSPKNLKQISVPPPALQGRGLAVTLVRGALRLKPIVAYVPPAAKQARKNPAYRKACSQLIGWIRKEIEATPTNTIPIVLIDGNFGLKPACAGDFTCGPFTRPFQNYAGDLFRQTAAETKMIFADTFFAVGHSFSNNRAKTRPDHILIPKSFLIRVLRSSIWHKRCLDIRAFNRSQIIIP